MRKNLKIVWLLLFALLLTSCSAPGTSSAETAEPTPTTPPVSTPMPGHSERTVITIGMMDYSSMSPHNHNLIDPGQRMIEQAVALFNTSSREYKIEIEYYGQFSRTNNDALLAVNSALSSAEHVPDLLYLGGLPTDAYIQRGLLADLSPLMEADGKLTREDLFPCIREACEVDGKIFYLSPNCMFTLYGGNSESLMTEEFADTEQVFRALEAHRDEGRTLQDDMTAEQFIGNPAILDRFVDYESGTCSFQSEEFLRVLELANRLPRSADTRAPAGATEQSSAALWVTDKYSTVFRQGLRAFTDYVQLETLMEGDYVPVEYLFSDGKYALCDLVTPIAIPTNAKHSEGAWEFIRYLFQSIVYLGIPTTYTGLESALTESKLPELWEIQREGKMDVREQMRQEMWDPYTLVDRVQSYPYTEEIYQEFLDFLEKSMILRIGYAENWKRTELQNIVYDEVNTFLNGNATAEQTAQALQSRVEICLAEQA